MGLGVIRLQSDVELEGKLGIINNKDGSEQIFENGDSFVVPKGVDTTWVVYEKVKKFYMISS